MRILLSILCLMLSACQHQSPVAGESKTIRFATYNTSLYSTQDGGLVARLEAGDKKASDIAAVIQQQRPDVLLLNEFDYDPAHRAADLFQQRYLDVGQYGWNSVVSPLPLRALRQQPAQFFH